MICVSVVRFLFGGSFSFLYSCCIFYVLIFLFLTGFSCHSVVFHSQPSLPGSDPTHLHLCPVAIKPDVFNLHISLSPFNLPVFTLAAGWHCDFHTSASASVLAVLFVFIARLSHFLLCLFSLFCDSCVWFCSLCFI